MEYIEYPRRAIVQGNSSKIFEIKSTDGIDFSVDFSASIVVKQALGVEQTPLLVKTIACEATRIYGALEPEDTTTFPLGDIYVTIEVKNLVRTPKFTREKTYLFTVYPQGA